MKRILAVVFAMLTLPLFGGVTYDFRSSSTGVRQGTLAGTVTVEGSSLRMDIKTGDNFLFKDNALVLSNDGGRTLSIFNPAAKTYYAMNLNDLLGSSTGILTTLGGSVKFTNPKVSVRDLGPGEPMAGFPTRHAAVDASYDINIEVMGNQMTTHMTTSTESWTTDRVSAEFMNFMQMKSTRTGFGDLDKLIEAQAAAINGRFPLKQVTTIRIRQNGSEMTSTTTSEVSNIVMKPIAKAVFVMPSGYTKVDDPMTRMMKTMR